MAYTPEMEQVVTEAAPFDFDGAKEVGAKIGMSARSVIAKAKSLGLDYIPKPAPVAKAKAVTKVELSKALRAATGLELVGIEKASRLALVELAQLVAEAP